MSSKHSFVNIRLHGGTDNRSDQLLRILFFGSLKKLQDNALKSRAAFLYTMHFFLVHHTNCEEYDEVKDELYEELETEGLCEKDENSIKAVIESIQILYRQRKIVYEKIRSTFLEQITEKFVLKNWDFNSPELYHEPSIRFGKKPFFNKHCQYVDSKMDVVVIDKKKKIIVLAECKSDLNGFFGKLERGFASKQPSYTSKNDDFRRGKNKVKYLREFNNKFILMNMDGSTSSIMTTYLNSRKDFFRSKQKSKIIKFVFAENMANTLFPQGDLVSN